MLAPVVLRLQAMRVELRRPGDAWRRENYRRWRYALRRESLHVARRVAECSERKWVNCAA